MKLFYNKLMGLVSLSLLVTLGLSTMLFQNCGGFQSKDAGTFESLQSSFGASKNFKVNHRFRLSVQKKEADHLGELDLIRYIAYCAKEIPLSYTVENSRAKRMMSKTIFSSNDPSSINQEIQNHVAVTFQDIYIEGDADFFLCFDHNNNDSCSDENITDLNEIINTTELGEFAVLFAREANNVPIHADFKNYFKESCGRNAAFFDKIRNEGLILYHAELADNNNRNRLLNGQVADNLRSVAQDTDPDDAPGGGNQIDDGNNGGNQADGGNNGGNNQGDGGNIDFDEVGLNENGVLVPPHPINDPYGRLDPGGITTYDPNDPNRPGGSNNEGGPIPLVNRGIRFNLVGLTDNDMSFDDNMPPPRVSIVNGAKGHTIITCQLRGTDEVCTKKYVRTGGCFVSGTKILMKDDESLPIELLKAGDEVVLLDGRTKKIKKVVAGPEKDPVVSLVTESGHKLRITQGHPMWSTKGYRLASDLRVKDQLVLADGKTTTIKSIQYDDYKHTVFNMELEGALAEDHIVVANGIASGDLYIQKKMAKEGAAPALAQRFLKSFEEYMPGVYAFLMK